jgi:hypothetical protein
VSFRLDIDDATFAEAAERLGVRPIGGRRDGFREKSRGEVVEAPDSSRYWLKLVGWNDDGHGALADGEVDPVQPVGVAKPAVIRSETWTRQETVWRAILMTLAPSPAVESRPWRRPGGGAPPDAWLNDLHDTLAALRRTSTTRTLFTPESMKILLMQEFGHDVPTEAADWAVCHGDLTWSNLTAPTLTLLDWEHWGLAPRGFDVARLVCCSTRDPATVRKLQALFRDELNSPSGDVAILTAIAGLRSMKLDAHVDIRTLNRIAGRILAQPKWLRGTRPGRALLWARRQWPISAAELTPAD